MEVGFQRTITQTDPARSVGSLERQRTMRVARCRMPGARPLGTVEVHGECRAMRAHPTCLDLLQRFGARYRIEFDPAYDAKHRPKAVLDTWYMTIPCLYGEAYPYGNDVLVAEVRGHPMIRRRLRALDCVTINQLGDTEMSVRFLADDFDRIASILHPRKRYKLSPEALEQRRRNLARWSSEKERTSGAPTGSQPPGRPEGHDSPSNADLPRSLSEMNRRGAKS